MTQDILCLTQRYLNQQADTYTQSDYDILVDVINHHTQLYHIQQSPIISDYEYDQLFDVCKTIESDHPERLCLDSPTRRVGSDFAESIIHEFEIRYYYMGVETRHITNAAKIVARQ